MAATPFGTYSGNITCSSAGSAAATIAIPTSTVTKKEISITGLTAANKTFDGTTAAGFNGSPAYAGLVNGESFTVLGNPVASFGTAGVGSGKTVTVIGYNAPSSNYNLLPVTLTSSITAKPVGISGFTATDKVYDGTTVASLVGFAQLSGVVDADLGKVWVAGTSTAEFLSGNVGTDIGISVSGYTLSGDAASNYFPVQPSGLTANITPKSATVRANDQNKSFGASLNMGTGKTQFTFDGLIPGESIGTVTLTADGGTASDALPGKYLITPSEPVAPRTIPINPFQALNYDLTFMKGTLTVTQDTTAGPTFEGWAGKDTVITPELLMKYAIGGAASPSAAGEVPVVAMQGSILTLTAIVRKDSALTIVGQAVVKLSDYGTTGSITEVKGTADGVSQDGVDTSVCERQKFVMEGANTGMRFLRIYVKK
jgi:hypothetical protein